MNEEYYGEIQCILTNYGVEIAIKDLKEIFYFNEMRFESNNNKILYRYGWMGYQVIDLVLALYSKKLFGEDLTRHQLKQKSDKYCTNDHFYKLIRKMKLEKYLLFANLKDMATVFEAIVYIIYRDKQAEGVYQFIQKIGFFDIGCSNKSSISINQEYHERVVEIIKDIKLLAEKVTLENSTKIYLDIYLKYKEIIEDIFYNLILKENKEIDFDIILPIVLSKFDIGKKIVRKNIGIILKLGMLFEDLEKGINKKEMRLYTFMKPEKVSEYVNHYILKVLNELLIV